MDTIPYMTAPACIGADLQQIAYDLNQYNAIRL
jgi:hypothetical protein